jgi:hypothetical protein
LQPCAAGDSDRVHLGMSGDVIVSDDRILGRRQRFAILIDNDRPEWPIPLLGGPVRELFSFA